MVTLLRGNWEGHKPESSVQNSKPCLKTNSLVEPAHKIVHFGVKKLAFEADVANHSLGKPWFTVLSEFTESKLEKFPSSIGCTMETWVNLWSIQRKWKADKQFKTLSLPVVQLQVQSKIRALNWPEWFFIMVPPPFFFTSRWSENLFAFKKLISFPVIC